MVPRGGTMGLQIDILSSFSFFSSTPLTFGCKDNLCGQGVGGWVGIVPSHDQYYNIFGVATAPLILAHAEGLWGSLLGGSNLLISDLD